MHCVRCDASETRVIETRTTEEGRVIRRRRECPFCGNRFTTYERVEESRLVLVVKKDGRREAFDRQKLLRGLVKACEKRPVSLEGLQDVAARIERAMKNRGQGEIPSTLVGELAMEELRCLDKVAYVRFASVYREFADVSAFADFVKKLDEKR
jgi:transcriptional repressor NrdR